ncbi:YbaK/EbsC family protein [Propionibacterium freudenreichii]|uniref:YbaK/EbsC family protein n=1 Tax=Propionibacterium freudenreichii TaxID=1744 RepID=UPI00101FC54B|nr:YbaK/EbsC family protein [Propionibacterium freudenreichii]
MSELTWLPLSEHPDLVAPVVAAAAAGIPDVKVAAIDESLADTAEFSEAYGTPMEESANCVIVSGHRAGVETLAAVLVLAVDRADINKTVRKHLGARKMSFAPESQAEAASGMRHGGITPIGLPADWPILIDSRVASAGPVIIDSGLRSSKLLVSGQELGGLPGATVLDIALPRN